VAAAAAVPVAFAVPTLLVTFFLSDAAAQLLAAGTLVGVSAAAPVDQGSTCVLLPGGKLVLSLDKETYETLGLQGKPSAFRETQHHGGLCQCTRTAT
jgi:hypothetical protein